MPTGTREPAHRAAEADRLKFDNSAANKANPDSTKNVHFGEQTTDEMMAGVVKLAIPLPPAIKTAHR